MKLKSAHLKLADGDTTNAEHHAERTHVWLLPLGIVRGAWGVLAAIALITLGISVPIYYEHLHTVCRAATTDACWQGRQLAAEQIPILEAHGLTLETYALYVSSLRVVCALATAGIALLLFWRKSAQPIALVVMSMLVLTTTLDPAVAPTWARLHPAGRLLDVVLYGLSAASNMCFLYLFPDGRFAPRWARWVLATYLLAVLQYFFAAAVAADLSTVRAVLTHPLLGLIVWGGTLLMGIGSQVYRYRYVSDLRQRQQTKWVLTAIVGFYVLTSPTVLPLAWNEPGALGFLIHIAAEAVYTPLLATAIAIAVFRFRLWDIDPIINRALVYGALTSLVVGMYVLIVGYLGALFQSNGNLVISLVATSVVAVLFQPLRERVQRGVNRLMYGRRDEPYTVIAQLGRQLESTLAPDEVLATIVETVRDALKLPYAAIALYRDGDSEIATERGSTPVPLQLFSVALRYQHDHIGELRLAPRGPGETFSPADQRLLDDLARQAGIAIYTLRLNANLQRTNAALQHARTQLVTAREEERRRLRRDLHDGFGSVLVSLNLRAGAIRSLLNRDPRMAAELAAEQQATIRDAIADVRRLVHALRPPILDEHGLVAALREIAAQQRTHPDLQITVTADQPLPPLSAAVDVAAYRIVQEALTNVIKHAQAQHCQIRLAAAAEQLRIEICDDGIGVMPARHIGIGLQSMRERAEELGGSFAIVTGPMSGAMIQACLPLADCVKRNEHD
jgi:signal transduction histidine kinase